ncbi:4-hydroxy-tetrahydrodipicolinate reductase [Hamadaea tsunoensis]|uniref:4-hydroxy-tetrahydrodipicolinate reductase n=1 Tax=Hamadaea tsunoensis TaxID=53368 RepID=UPI00041F6A91|nr:4-hydroxy-tetrahydrodipicolinate reductase [Hamadaea tsunoensis]
MTTQGTDPIRVAVLGARGRMGGEVCRTVEATAGLDLAAALDQGDDLAGIVDAGAAVVVDFTHPGAVMDNLEWCIARGVHVVVGTSGFTEQRTDTVRAWLADRPGVGVVIAPNFAIGAVLMMEFAGRAAKYFESIEIIEQHHPQKLDAPSGTALRTAEIIAAARKEAGQGDMPDATRDLMDGARGATVEGVHVHSVRARGLVAHQEIIFGTQGETLTIRHDSFDRSSFMPGVVLAIRSVISRPGLTVGLDALL